MMRNQRGFTLVEIVITLLVIGMIIVGLSTLFITLQRVQAQATYTEIANRAAQRQVESLRNSSYNNLTPGEDISFTDELPNTLPSGATGNVEVTEPTQGLRKVDVSVTYEYAGSSRTITHTSLIGILGITQ
jgi:prepilin-type N-terminal cleavage/methylation domain-containing protein